MGALEGMQQGLGKTRIGTWKTVQGTQKPLWHPWGCTALLSLQENLLPRASSTTSSCCLPTQYLPRPCFPPHSPRSGCSHTRTELGGAPRATRAWWFPPTQCSSVQQSCMGVAVGLPRVPQSRRPCGPLPALPSPSQLTPWPKGPSCLLLPRLPFTEGSPNKSAPLMPSCLPF